MLLLEHIQLQKRHLKHLREWNVLACLKLHVFVIEKGEVALFESQKAKLEIERDKGFVEARLKSTVLSRLFYKEAICDQEFLPDAT